MCANYNTYTLNTCISTNMNNYVCVCVCVWGSPSIATLNHHLQPRVYTKLRSLMYCTVTFPAPHTGTPAHATSFPATHLHFLPCPRSSSHCHAPPPLTLPRSLPHCFEHVDETFELFPSISGFTRTKNLVTR